MHKIEKLPPAFKRHRKMGGVLDFAIFEDADGGEEEILSAISAAYGFDTEKLRTLGSRQINDRAFFGDWYDRETGSLIQRGSWATADGRKLENPPLKTTEGMQLVSGAAPCPEAGSGGQFAYAFLSPPYPIRARPREVQAAFEEIRDFILPPLHWHEILDWTSPRLGEVSDYFRMGMEWWGVFLFSIHVPALRRLTIIVGSATD
ncbi:MAG TPA: hypothetical protein VF693_04045 [Allosphingosinicella sp.]|jgi:hypothetical protein